MKKFRIIITSVIVLAIVGSAFAVKEKGNSYCVRTGITSGNCTTIKQNFRLTNDILATKYMIFLLWDGNRTKCTQDASGSCVNQFGLLID